MSEEKKTYQFIFTCKISGQATLIVEAETEEEAIRLALDGDIDDSAELDYWEFDTDWELT